MGRIALEQVSKSFGEIEVIPPLDLEIDDGEFAVFVGPSGCGKSTLLRLVAGLEDVSGGVIKIDDRDVTRVPPAKRGLAMVFQSYALYPHMTVRKNIAFPLRMAGLDRQPRLIKEKRRGGREATLNLSDYLDRRPGAALGRSAPARRNRPRHRARAGRVSLRRAALQPRRGAAREHAARDLRSSIRHARRRP